MQSQAEMTGMPRRRIGLSRNIETRKNLMKLEL